jgi:hypothetical protein
MATKSLLYALEKGDAYVWMLDKWRHQKSVIADARARNSRRLSWLTALLFGSITLLITQISVVKVSVALAGAACLMYTIFALTEKVKGLDLEFLEAARKLQEALAFPSAIKDFERMREQAVNDLVDLHYRVCLNERDKDDVIGNQKALALRTKFTENHEIFLQFDLVDHNPRTYRDRAIEKFNREQREKAEFEASMTVTGMLDADVAIAASDTPPGGGMPG